jgi:hypothetical protein
MQAMAVMTSAFLMPSRMDEQIPVTRKSEPHPSEALVTIRYPETDAMGM